MPARLNTSQRVRVVVVLPVPPFWESTVIVVAMARRSSHVVGQATGSAGCAALAIGGPENGLPLVPFAGRRQC